MRRIAVLGSFALLIIAALIAAVYAPSSGAHTLSSPPDFTFPAATTAMPEKACHDFANPGIAPDPLTCGNLAGFDRTDYEGQGDGDRINERMSWVTDPGGSTKKVMQMDVYGTDTADRDGGTRTSLWRSADNCSGCDAWQVWGVYIPTTFVTPDTFFLLYQDFATDPATGFGNPAQALEIKHASGSSCAGGTPRDHFCWVNRTSQPDSGTDVDLGAVNEGHWFYIIEHIKFSSDAAVGYDTVWAAYDSLPSTNNVGNVHWLGKTLYDTNPGRSNIMEYRDPSSVNSQHQVVFFCGFHRASTLAAASVLSNCPG